MKNKHIISLIIVALFVGLLIFTLKSANQHVTFAEALENPGTEVSISGTLYKESPVLYDPETNASLTIFKLIDDEGNVLEVHLNKAQPQGLLQSESIVLDGQVRDGIFHASEMLLKCPSKYNEKNHLISEGA